MKSQLRNQEHTLDLQKEIFPPSFMKRDRIIVTCNDSFLLAFAQQEIRLQIETKLLQFLLDAFADRIIVNQLNKIAEVGFPLPMVDGIQIMNAEVMSGQGFNMVAADIKYEPTKTETERGMNKIVIV
ncbi:hypothetical protein P5673_023499 [Acropora cervicornis]|uniref:Lipid-binding serum glycoprotein C-terminal domain-containing protein n=1 Tax=Acropora cervicornis TaxID=6130 RepID=A0AAD9UZ28_ACRCE|nr:hypothetical protein P5673_023499 [Acropora cervicornis]